MTNRQDNGFFCAGIVWWNRAGRGKLAASGRVDGLRVALTLGVARSSGLACAATARASTIETRDMCIVTGDGT